MQVAILGAAPTGSEAAPAAAERGIRAAATGDAEARRRHEPPAERPAPRLGARVTTAGRDRLLGHDEVGTGRRVASPLRLLRVGRPQGDDGLGLLCG